ncbi:MAG: hypothetical protein KBB78_02675, partial [Candidatus Pacebacteria bacterium]|nr:hypothetical protein [Candidatus Paceibacterota bacterium]
MRNIMLGLVLALTMALGTLTSAPAEAREVYHGFVKDTHYLGRGGTPATLEQVADNPLSVFRSELAYANLRAHIGSYLGRPVTDADFRLLMRSDAVKLIPCVGKIDTSGVTDSGRFGWHKRHCYRGEMLIQVRLSDGRWLTVASQGCYNPVRGEAPSLVPAPPPVVKKTSCRMVPVRQHATSRQELTFLPGFV